MTYVTYIIYSENLKKYYCGHTCNLNRRIEEHNSGKSKFASKGIPWKIIKVFEAETKGDAMRLENEIKKRGCKRYIENLKLSSLK